MAYIDKSFYDEVYKGVPIDQDVFFRLSERASDVVDQITGYKVTDVNSLHHSLLTNFKKAVAAQIEYMNSLGGELVIHGGSPSSVNIGNFSYSEGGSQHNSEPQMVSPAVIGYLKTTGLLYKGLTVYDC